MSHSISVTLVQVSIWLEAPYWDNLFLYWDIASLEVNDEVPQILQEPDIQPQPGGGCGGEAGRQDLGEET